MEATYTLTGVANVSTTQDVVKEFFIGLPISKKIGSCHITTSYFF